MADGLARDLLAKQKISHFLARAVADEILPPSFLTDPLVEGMGGGIVASTKVILSKQHGLVRLSKVWGPGDGRPVAELKEELEARGEGKSGNKAWLRRRLHAAIVREYLDDA